MHLRRPLSLLSRLAGDPLSDQSVPTNQRPDLGIPQLGVPRQDKCDVNMRALRLYGLRTKLFNLTTVECLPYLRLDRQL